MLSEDAQYRILVEQIRDYGIFLLDPNGLVSSWNEGARRLKGYEATEILGRHFSRLLHPRGRGRGQTAERTGAGPRQGRAEDEGWRLRKDGSRFWANVVITSLHDTAGALKGFAKVTRDFSERRQAEELFRGLMESAPDAMVVADAGGTIVMVNAQSEKLFGYGREELVGRPLELLVPERFRQGHRGKRQGYAQDPRHRAMGAGAELFALRKDGSELPVEISLSPVQTPNGPLVASSVRDVSGRRSLEAALRRANEELTRKNEEVERASRMKSDFLAGMSHELRTPLNSIIGFSEIIQDGRAGPVSEQQREFLGDVLSGAQRLLQLINDLLDLSKIEAGKLVLRMDRVDLGGLLKRSAAQLRPLADKRHVSMALEHDPAVDGALADEGRLQQILQNFLSNALKFSPEGSQVVLRSRDAGMEYRLEVQDQGIGISPQDQAKLFSDFVQLDAGTAKQYQGTGLGLALCRKIAEAHGGRVGVESRPQEGSLFYVQLPKKPQPKD